MVMKITDPEFEAWVKAGKPDFDTFSPKTSAPNKKLTYSPHTYHHTYYDRHPLARISDDAALAAMNRDKD